MEEVEPEPGKSLEGDQPAAGIALIWQGDEP